MTMTAIPALDRTSGTFKADVDTFFASRMPTFVTEANALQTDVTAKQVLASAAAVTAQAAIDAGLANAAANATTATTQAGIATTKAGEANSSAIAAAASAASISGGPVASVNGMTGVVTGVATLTAVQTLTNKTLTGYTETVYALSGTVIDPVNGTVQTKTLAANTTFTESLADGQSLVLMLNPATYTTTWPTTSWVRSDGAGTAPTLKASVVNTIVLWQVGGVLYGNFIGSM